MAALEEAAVGLAKVGATGTGAEAADSLTRCATVAPPRQRMALLAAYAGGRAALAAQP